MGLQIGMGSALLGGILFLYIRSLRSEQKVRRRYEVLLNAVPCTISWLSRERYYVEANQNLLDMIGVERAEFVGQKLGFHDMDPDYRDFVESVFNSKQDRMTYEFSVYTGEGPRHIFSVAQKYNGGEEVAIIGLDVSELKEKERQILEQEQALIQREKLSNLGQMAGSMGHEINNPITVILLSVYDLKEMVESGKLDINQMKTNLDRIEKTGVRISKIVKGLKAVSREGSGDPFELVPLQSVIDDTMALCQQRMTGHGIEFRTNLNGKEFFLWGQSTQITQVLLNLLSNAIDAVDMIPEGEAKWIEVKAEMVSGGMIHISVSDSGPGVPAEVLKKIFEPFFTTKPVGQGTGLGLSISRSIISRHNGKLRYDGSKGHACFVIEMPPPPDAQAKAV